MTTTLTPFVVMLFPEDPFGRHSLDLYKNYLRKLDVRQMGDLTQSVQASKKVRESRDISKQKAGYSFFATEIHMDLFDPDFYVLESHFFQNAKSSDLWFGWVDDKGDIFSDYKISVQLKTIKPKVTPTGTALSLYLVHSMEAQRGPISMLNKILTQTRTFIPGGQSAKFAADKAVLAAQKQYWNSSGTRTGKLPQPSINTYYYERITDIVSFICSQAGIEVEVDPSPKIPQQPPGSGTHYEFRMVNQTPMQFLEELATYATNVEYLDEISDNEYFVWVEASGKVVFRSSKITREADKKPLTINYLSDNTSTIEDLVRGRDPKGGRPAVIIDLDLDINLAPYAEALVGVKAVSVDPVGKKFKGVHLSPTSPISDKQARLVLGLDDPRNTTWEYQGNSYSQTPSQAADNGESRKLIENGITVANRFDEDMNWFVYEAAQTLIDNPDPKYAAKRVATSTSVAYITDEQDNGAAKYAQYVSQLGERGAASIAPEDAQNAVAKSDLDDAQDRRNKEKASDTTVTGQMEVRAHYDNRTAIDAANIYRAALRDSMDATVTILGDVTVKVLDKVNLYVNLPPTFRAGSVDAPALHFTSGEYDVLQVNHIIDMSAFTTQMVMNRKKTTIAKAEKQNKPGIDSEVFVGLVGKYAELDSADATIRAKASIGPGGEGRLPPKTGESTNGVVGEGVVPTPPTGGGGDFGEGFNPGSSLFLVDGQEIDFDGLDPTQFSPVRSAYINKRGGIPIAGDGPNINRSNAILFDPDGAISGYKSRRIDIFSLPGSKTNLDELL